MEVKETIINIIKVAVICVTVWGGLFIGIGALILGSQMLLRLCGE